MVLGTLLIFICKWGAHISLFPISCVNSLKYLDNSIMSLAHTNERKDMTYEN